MRVLVYPHDLAMGGSQLNAIELAAAVRDRGHEVIVYGQPGTLNGRIAELGLQFVASPRPRLRPTPRLASHLGTLIDALGVDVVHGWEWPPILEAAVAARTRANCVAVGSVMSMSIAPFIPRRVPLTVGTRQIAHVERLSGRSDVEVLEPPVDLLSNTMDPGSAARFRLQHGIGPWEPLVVVVSRLAQQLKLEGLLTAISQVPRLDGQATLLVVGDGPVRAVVHAAALDANAAAGRRAVVLAGELEDPRPAYAAADVILGMGGSVLRGMAFGKPVVVQGEAGFWRRLSPESVDSFRWTGWYGVGVGREAGPAAFRAAVGPLVSDLDQRTRSAEFAREVVKEFALDTKAAALERWYETHRNAASSTRLEWSDAVAAWAWARHVLRRRLPGYVNQGGTEDFNQKPTAQTAPERAA